ncbi:hypothetical protein D3C80_767370 [compost metagenome]
MGTEVQRVSDRRAVLLEPALVLVSAAEALAQERLDRTGPGALGDHRRRIVRIDTARIDQADLGIQLRIVERRVGVIDIDLGLNEVVPPTREGRINDRETRRVRRENLGVREGVLEPQLGILSIQQQLGVCIDLPEIFCSDVVSVQSIGLDAAGQGYVVHELRRVKDTRTVSGQFRAVEHERVSPVLIQREGIVGPQFARFERAIGDADFPLGGSIGLLGHQADDAHAAIRAEEQGVAAPEHLDPLDHMRVNRGRTPDILQRRPAVIERHPVQNDQGVAVAAPIQTDRVFALVRRVANVHALGEELHQFGHVGGAAGPDFLGADHLHLTTELDRLGRLLRSPDARDNDIRQSINAALVRPLLRLRQAGQSAGRQQ